MLPCIQDSSALDSACVGGHPQLQRRHDGGCPGAEDVLPFAQHLTKAIKIQVFFICAVTQLMSGDFRVSLNKHILDDTLMMNNLTSCPVSALTQRKDLLSDTDLKFRRMLR